MNRKTRRLLSLLLAVLTVLMQLTVAYADDGIADVEELTGKGENGANSLSGGGHYMSNRYKDNYYLDIEELGIMDMIPGAGSFLANMLFSLDRKIVELSALFFYQCNTFQLAELMESTMNNVQKSLKEQIFDALLPFAVIALGAFLVQSLVKHNGQAILGQTISFFGVMLMATLMTTQTASVVRAIDDLTMGVTKGLVNAIYNIGSGNESGGGSNYAVEVAGNMWDTMVHMPWVTLNLDGDDGGAEALLSLSPHAEKRAQIIEEKVKDKDNTLFTKDKPSGQVALLLLYTVPLLLKCATYICIGGLQLAFRIFTIMIVLFGIIILFLALIPQLGGSSLVWSWGRKILSIQINIIILALVLSFIMLIDRMMYDLIPAWGWIVVILAQTAVCITVFLLRDKILDFSKTVSSATVNPTMAMYSMQHRMKNAGNGIYDAARATGDFAGGIASKQLTRTKANFDGRMEAWGEKIIAERQQASPVRRSYYSSDRATDTSTRQACEPEQLHRPRLYMSSERQTVGGDTAAGTTALASPARYRVYGHGDKASTPIAVRATRAVDLRPTTTVPYKAAAEIPQTPPAPWRQPTTVQSEQVVPEGVTAAASPPDPAEAPRRRAYRYNVLPSAQMQGEVLGNTPKAADIPRPVAVHVAEQSQQTIEVAATASKRPVVGKPEPPGQEAAPKAAVPRRAAVATTAAPAATSVPTIGRGTPMRQSSGEGRSKRTRYATAKIDPVAAEPNEEATDMHVAAKAVREPIERVGNTVATTPKRYYPKKPLPTAVMHPANVKGQGGK